MTTMKINKRKTIFWTICFLVLFTPLFMFLFWYFSPFKPINVLLIDKTVNNEKRQEHSSINWVLNYEKYSKKNEELYNKDSDYYGFFPQKNEKFLIRDFEKTSERGLDSLVAKNEVFFYNDTYGVYTDEWYRHNYDNERSIKVYGGATMNEVKLLSKAKVKKKLIITEFNLVASPTSHAVRREIEKEFGFKWSNWVGRYYDVLDTLKNVDLPVWMKQNYVKEHHKWPFKKSGIVFVSNDGLVEILENETHLKSEDPVINTYKKYQEEFELPAKIKYNFWFDIIATSKQNHIMSYYTINSNKKGDSILAKYKLPKVFPAIISNNDNSFYYFSGDFSDNKNNKYTEYFKGIGYFKYFMIDKEDKSDRIYFFWNFYKPLLTTIFDKEYQKKQSNLTN